MEFRTDVLNEKPIQNLGRVTKMKLDEESQSMIFQMFTGGLYSDPIGTLIREITSNCFDSHVEAGVDSTKNPVIVELIKEVSGKFIKFQDKGVGMSPERIENIYGTYFKSTKRKTNDQIGGFGLGGKTPLAYTESFFIETVSEKENDINYCKDNLLSLQNNIESFENEIKNSKKFIDENINLINDLEVDDTIDNDERIEQINDLEYENVDFKQKIVDWEIQIETLKLEIKDFEARLYMVSNIKEPSIKYIYNVFEGNNVPQIENLSISGTTEKNGTIVKVPIKNDDVEKFEEKTLRQLYYFENIVFKGFNEDIVSNKYNIVKGKNFLYRGITYSDHMHVCYGKVAYPIDFNAIGLNQNNYAIPIAIKLEIGELEGTGVTPSREALKYSSANVKIIKNKIDAAIEEIKELLVKQYENVTTLFDYYMAKERFGTLHFDDNNEIYVGRLIKIQDLEFPKFKFKDLRIPPSSDIISTFYNVKLFGKKYSKRKWTNDGWSSSLLLMKHFNNIYHCNTSKFTRKNIKQSYLKTLAKSQNFYLIHPKDFDNLNYVDSLIKKFGLSLSLEADDNRLFDKKTNYSYGEAKEIIIELFHELHEIVKSYSQGNYDDIEIPSNFILPKKIKTLNNDLLETVIPVKDHSRSNLKLKDFFDFKGKIYYGFRDDEYTIIHCRMLFNSINGSNRIKSGHSIEYKTSSLNGILFISISKQNEKYMKMLGRKAIHVDYFYQTYINRKIDDIIESKKIQKHRERLETINSLYFDKLMLHVDTEIFDLSTKIKTYFNENKFQKRYAKYIDLATTEKTLGINLEKRIDSHKFKYEKELSKLIEINEKYRMKLKWIDIPNHFDENNTGHKELINLLKLIIV